MLSRSILIANLIYVASKKLHENTTLIANVINVAPKKLHENNNLTNHWLILYLNKAIV